VVHHSPFVNMSVRGRPVRVGHGRIAVDLKTTMGDVVVFNSVTLDGVLQAPGRPDEDVWTA
jgi:hypothetical protein